MPIHIRVEGQYVPPEMFVEHAGVRVYRTYHIHDEAPLEGTNPNDPIERLFTTYTDEDPDESSCFDVLMLPEAKGHEDDISDFEVQRSIIMEAIDNRHLDSVGMRGFRVDVSFVLVMPGGEEEILEELPMQVETMNEKIPIMIGGLNVKLSETKPWDFYRSNSVVGFQSLRLSMMAPENGDTNGTGVPGFGMDAGE